MKERKARKKINAGKARKAHKKGSHVRHVKKKGMQGT